MSILEVKNLKKYYERDNVVTKAVDDVSFSIEEGEFVAIVGTSGSGKSTLLHLIGGVDDVSDGEIWINNTNINNLKDDKKTIFRRQNTSIIYQFYNLIPVLNVIENIVLPIKLNHQSVKQEQIDFLIELFKLNGKQKNLPSQLSGGQQQRVAIARSLITKPSIILADEPTGNLDKKNSEDIVDYFCKINTTQKQTILMVTHDMQIARRAHRILIMEDGKIVEDKVNHNERTL